MKPQPKISVVVTSYNHEQYIAQCLDSILMQRGAFELEVILGDDCSTDRTPLILQQYAEKNPGVFVLLPAAANMGVTRNIKRCLAACSGQYIAFCEGDDYWLDCYKLLKQLEFLESHPAYSLCFNGIVLHYESGNRYVLHHDQAALTKNTLTTEDLIESNFIGNFSCCMYRADVVRALPQALFTMCTWDWMFNMACSRLGKIGFIRDWMSVYRIRSHGAWSGRSSAEQRKMMVAAIDSYDAYFDHEYHEAFSRLKRRLAGGHWGEPASESPRLRRYLRLLMRAIAHPDLVRDRLRSSIAVAFGELTSAAVSTKIAELSSSVADLRSSDRAKDAQISELSAAVQMKDREIAELGSAVQTRDARLAILDSMVPVKHVDLLVLDTLFPHPLSRFRLEEFCSYLKHFRNSLVLSTGEHLPIVAEIAGLDTLISEFETMYPQFTERTRGTTREIDGYGARLAYLIFLNNVSYFLESLENKGIPFVFTLYPGGGFAIDQDSSDSKLRRVFSSAQFRGVIVTQQITSDYLVKNKFCPEDRITYLYGGVMPLDILDKSNSYERAFFGFEKGSLDICFVAVKYMPMGVDKGYDVFIEAAKKLAQLHSNINFHVVGNWTEADVPIDGLEDRVTFYGFRELDWFDRFYADKDVILSPNIPFRLSEGAFDGFPTAACVEAGLRKVAVFCTDELKLNDHFADNEEIVIIPHAADRIVRIIEAFYERPDKLRSLAERGAARMSEIFGYESQVLPRIKLIEREMQYPQSII